MGYLTGFHAIEESIRARAAAGLESGPLLLAKAGPRAREIVALATRQGIRLERIGAHELDRIAPDNKGIALLVEDSAPAAGPASVEEFLSGLGERESALALILDEITDPHNYGAILRSCDQFGADVVISRNRRSAKNADAVAKTSAGASAWVAQAEAPNLVRALGQLKDAGFWVYAADPRGEPAHKVDLRGRVALALGAEGSGVSRLLAESCDGRVGIPSIGKIDSLNVSVAAGVLLYEARRQRLTRGGA
ncbi:MAG: 23S rRNA (guanosine(2251)-2'-O)-methyltransferase RlmB [Treponema sp.]|nr:23S rRNA (guanosine(2251)-2'-O)-methyltransferase RlmB [Treponema sp.]